MAPAIIKSFVWLIVFVSNRQSLIAYRLPHYLPPFRHVAGCREIAHLTGFGIARRRYNLDTGRTAFCGFKYQLTAASIAPRPNRLVKERAGHY